MMYGQPIRVVIDEETKTELALRQNLDVDNID